MTENARRGPLFLVCVGGIAVLGSILLAARTDDTELGSGLVFNTVLGFGMLAGGLLLLGGAFGAERLYQGAAMRSRRNTLFFRMGGVVGLVAILYGAALLSGG